AAAQELVAAGVDIAIVVLLHSYRNPVHERAVRDIIERHGVPLRLELSSEVWAQAREYERGVLTAVNASIRPIVEGYVERLDRGLQHRRRRRLDIVARPHRLLEDRAEKRRRRSWPGLLWHLGFAHPGVDRCVFGRGAARAGTAARRQAAVADGAGTRRARDVGGTARHG